MSKTKKAILIFIEVYIFICLGLLIYKAIDPIYLLPKPWLGRGIHKIMGIDSGLIWSPNGKYLAGLISKFPLPDCPGPIIFCMFGNESYSEIYILDLTKMEKRTVSRSDEFEKFGSEISWFPDGEHIAYMGAGTGSKGVIRSIDIDGKNDVQFMSESGYPLWHPSKPLMALSSAISKLGKWYSAIYLVDLSTMKKDLIFQGANSNMSILSLSWSADGKTLAISYGTSDWQETQRPNIYFLDLETKKLIQFTNDNYEYWSAGFSPVNNLIALQRVNDNEKYYYRQHTTIIKDLIKNCEVELPIYDTYSTSWSPDGQQLVVSGGGDAYIVNLAEYFGNIFTDTGSICP